MHLIWAWGLWGDEIWSVLGLKIKEYSNTNICQFNIDGIGLKHPGGPSTGPWLSKNCCFALTPARFHVANDHQKKTSALLWFATLTGFCAAKPDERTKWPFLFTAWKILQLRQLRSASRSQCVPISIVDFECLAVLTNDITPHPTPPHA